MEIEDEINKERKKAEADRKIGEITLENSKNRFADYILKTNVRHELENCNAYAVNSTYKLKLPLKVRMKRFFNKIKIVFGHGAE